MTSFNGTNALYLEITDLDDNLIFGQPFITIDDNFSVLNNQDESYGNGLFWQNLEDSYQSNISINGNTLSNNIIDTVISSIPDSNTITLEVTNDLDTNIIDESDGLSLGEAIQITIDASDNNYTIEIPGGSNYNATVTEDFDNLRSLSFRGIGEGVAEINLTRAGESVLKYQLAGEILPPNTSIINSVNNFNSQLAPAIISPNLLTLTNINNPLDIDNNALELTGGTAQIAYVAYYGRPADERGLNFWNDALSTNEVSYAPRRLDFLTGSEEDIYNNIVNQFGNSAEADRLFGGLSNRERVDRVYQFAFDRDADIEGANFWTSQLDLGNVTLATFALEVALGAQNEDIATLNNKIESANLFSNSIETEAEVNAYTGTSGEVFGREWLDDFGTEVSSAEQVDMVLTNLVESEF